MSKLERSCVKVRVKLCRSWSEVVSKFERSYFAKFASKWNIISVPPVSLDFTLNYSSHV